MMCRLCNFIWLSHMRTYRKCYRTSRTWEIDDGGDGVMHRWHSPHVTFSFPPVSKKSFYFFERVFCLFCMTHMPLSLIFRPKHPARNAFDNIIAQFLLPTKSQLPWRRFDALRCLVRSEQNERKSNILAQSTFPFAIFPSFENFKHQPDWCFFLYLVSFGFIFDRNRSYSRRIKVEIN